MRQTPAADRRRLDRRGYAAPSMRFPRRRREPPSTKLHVGAFDVAHDGWLNTDVTPHMAIARVPGLPASCAAPGGSPTSAGPPTRPGSSGACTTSTSPARCPIPTAPSRRCSAPTCSSTSRPARRRRRCGSWTGCCGRAASCGSRCPTSTTRSGATTPRARTSSSRAAPGPRALDQPAPPLVALQRAVAARAARAHGLHRRPPDRLPGGAMPGRRADRLAPGLAVHGGSAARGRPAPDRVVATRVGAPRTRIARRTGA